MIPHDTLSRKRLLAISDIVLLPVIVILVGAGSFFLGRFSALDACRGHLVIHPPGNAKALATQTPATPDFLGEPKASNIQAKTVVNTGPSEFVASKNGSKYYLTTCSGAKSINETNRVYFATKQEAENAGYTPAVNCAGM